MGLRGTRKRLGKHLGSYLFVVPAFVFLLVFTYWPLVNSFRLSLTRYDVSLHKFVFQGAANYARMLKSELFWLVMQNTALYSSVTVLASVLAGLLLAVLLTASSVKLKRFFRFALFYPYILPTAAASMVWLWIYNPSYGILNTFLRGLGLPSQVNWVNDGKYALWSIMAVAIWKYVGYYMIIFQGGLLSIDKEFYDAARVEGASSWQEFRHVTLALLAPTTFFVAIIAVINSLQSVDQVIVMTQGGPHESSNVLLFFIYQNAFFYADIAYGAALSFFLLVILLTGTVAYFSLLQRLVFYER